MNALDWATLNATVRQIILLEKTKTSLALQIGALRRDGVPAIAIAGCIAAEKAIKKDVNRWKRQVAKDWKASPVAKWASGVHGLGPAITLVLGIMPPLTDQRPRSTFPGFATVSRLWKYAGFAPGQKPKRGEKLNFSPQLKAFMTIRIADPCIKHRESPYRRDYDARRALTAVTHPEWTDGHSHNDARRIVAKAVLRDMWLVAHGKEAKIDKTGGGPNIRVEPKENMAPASRSNEKEGEAIVGVGPKTRMPRPSKLKKEAAAIVDLRPPTGVPSSSPSTPGDGQEGHPLPGTHVRVAPLSRRRSSHVLETA